MKPSDLFVLDGAGWPALLVDEAGTILRSNAAAVQSFGPVIQSPGSQLAVIWAAENPQLPAGFFAHWVQTPTPNVSLKFKWKAGGVASHTVSVCALQSDMQRCFLLQLLGETANADALVAQKQKLDCALQLARTVSLDFNNALTSILGHTSLLLGKMERDNPVRASLMEVEKSAARAAEISNDLASFSRQEKETREQASGNLNELVQRCVEVFQRKPPPPEVKWVLHTERRLFQARFDEAKLLQALTKVVENAVEAIEGSGQIGLTTRNVELQEATKDRGVHLAAGNYVCIEVVDTGKGIAPDVLPRVFEPFFTTKRNHRGLGLAWVYGIVSNHGGAVVISSAAGGGTSARLYLPAEQRLVREVAAGGADLRGTETILLVDDEDLVLTMGQMILNEYGYKVVTANSGQRALEILTKGEPPVQLLVTDLVMPGMSGRELMEQARQIAPETRVLCTSGYAWPTSRDGDPAYLQKPFTSQELLLKVKHLLH
jgi:signal transduction histidine kinase